MGYEPAQLQRPRSIVDRIGGIVVLVVIILITCFLIIVGYMIDTVWDYNLSISSIYSSLPSAAKGAFGTSVTYTLTTYSFIVGLIIILFIAGTIAAIFGLQSKPEDLADAQPEDY